MAKLPLNDADDSSAVILGGLLAETLAESLAHENLTPRKLVLSWIAALARLHSICDEELGFALYDHVFRTMESVVRQKRAKTRAARRPRSRRSHPVH